MSIGNDALVAAVRNRLIGDWRIAALAIDVHCSDGHVSLIGIVDTEEQRTLALEIVTGLMGVRTVKDGLSVKQAKTTICSCVEP